MTKPTHERDLVGQDIVDYEDRVDVARLKRERLARLQQEMANAELGGILFFDPVNIRYATGVRSPGAFSMRFFVHYGLIPREGKPVLFPLHAGQAEDESFFREKPGRVFDYFPVGRSVEPAARAWAADIKEAMRELGIADERLGVDKLEYNSMEALLGEGVRLADGRVPTEKARAIKTQDEVSLIRLACAIADVAICNVRDAIKPGITENELYSILVATNLRYGGEHTDDHLLSAGGGTNPWFRSPTDRIVRPGDLVAYDTDMAGPMGYFADVSRTYLCGDGKPNAEQLEAYRLSYNFIYESMHLFQPGASFVEIAEKAPPFPDAYKPGRYVMIAHGVGMSDEWPTIHWPDRSWGGFGNDPDVLQGNMIISLEGLASKPGARESVKLEEQLLITANGPEILSRAPFDWRFLD